MTTRWPAGAGLVAAAGAAVGAAAGLGASAGLAASVGLAAGGAAPPHAARIAEPATPPSASAVLCSIWRREKRRLTPLAILSSPVSARHHRRVDKRERYVRALTLSRASFYSLTRPVISAHWLGRLPRSPASTVRAWQLRRQKLTAGVVPRGHELWPNLPPCQRDIVNRTPAPAGAVAAAWAACPLPRPSRTPAGGGGSCRR